MQRQPTNGQTFGGNRGQNSAKKLTDFNKNANSMPDPLAPVVSRNQAGLPNIPNS